VVDVIRVAVGVMTRRSKKKAPQYWQNHNRANPTVAPMPSRTTGVEIDYGSVDQDASLDNSRMFDDMNLPSSEGRPIEDIAIAPTIERSISTSHAGSSANAHIESSTGMPVCLEIEAAQSGSGTVTKAQYVLPDRVKQAQDIISSCLNGSETTQKDAIADCYNASTRQMTII
jgi:hypothetical protein